MYIAPWDPLTEGPQLLAAEPKSLPKRSWENFGLKIGNSCFSWECLFGFKISLIMKQRTQFPFKLNKICFYHAHHNGSYRLHLYPNSPLPFIPCTSFHSYHAFFSVCCVLGSLWNGGCCQQSPVYKDTKSLEIAQFYFTDEKPQVPVAIISKSDCKAGILKEVYDF